MKKIAIALMLMAAGLTASAQSTDYMSNLQVNLGGGVHSMLYTPADGESSLGFGGLFGLQYQQMFNHNIGLAAGVQASCLNGKAVYNYAFNTGIMDDRAMLTDERDYTLTTQFKNWREKQDIIIVSVPVELMIRVPMSVKSAFQMGLGATLDFPLDGTYKANSGSRTVTAYVPATNVTYDNLENHGFGTFDANYKGEFSTAKFTVGIVADLGFVVNLTETAGLYLGLYGNYMPSNLVINESLVENQPLPDMLAYGSECPNPALNTNYKSSMNCDRVTDEVKGLEAGIKIGIRLGMGKKVDWKDILAAEEAAAAARAQAEADSLAALERAKAEAAAKAEADRIAAEKAKAEAAKAQAEAEKAKADAERAKAEAAKAAADAKAAAEKAAADAKAEAERLAAERAAADKAAAEKALADAEARAKAEAEARAKAEAEARERARAEQKAREEAAFLAGYKDIAYFETGKDTPNFGELNEDSWANLKEVMDNHPEIKVLVTGHTDNVGKPASNKALSQKRADNIKKMLEGKGIDPTRIESVGKGDTEPIADNKTKEGRSKNRRIEITIGK